MQVDLMTSQVKHYFSFICSITYLISDQWINNVQNIYANWHIFNKIISISKDNIYFFLSVHNRQGRFNGDIYCSTLLTFLHTFRGWFLKMRFFFFILSARNFHFSSTYIHQTLQPLTASDRWTNHLPSIFWRCFPLSRVFLRAHQFMSINHP